MIARLLGQAGDLDDLFEGESEGGFDLNPHAGHAVSFS
jgi:hypothetical protein